MLGRLLGRRQRRPRDTAVIDRIKELTRALVAPTGEVDVTVSEIECRDPSCPGLETVILIMEPGRRTRAVKLAKPKADLTELDLRVALDREPAPS